jgi:hypothetical protein
MYNLGSRIFRFARTQKARRIALAVVLALLVVRKVGFVELNAYSSQSRSTCFFVPMEKISAPLSEDERQWQREWKVTAPSSRDGLKIFYRDSGENPWTRWIPLFKSGTTTLRREFFVVRDGLRILSGQMMLTTDQTVLGLISARRYSALVAPNEADFVKAVQGEMEKASAAVVRK